MSAVSQLSSGFRASQTTLDRSRAPGAWRVLLSLAPYVYGDGVLRVWHAGDAGQCAGEALPCVPGPWVSALLGTGGAANTFCGSCQQHYQENPDVSGPPLFSPANVLGVTFLLGPVDPLPCRA